MCVSSLEDYSRSCSIISKSSLLTATAILFSATLLLDLEDFSFGPYKDSGSLELVVDRHRKEDLPAERTGYPNRKKLGIAFLLNDRLTFHEMWAEYFLEVPEHLYSVGIHLSNGRFADDAAPLRFNYTRISTFPTKWCRLVPMMHHVYRKMIEDPEVFGVILVSDGHIPLKRLSYAHDKLFHTNHSIFGVRKDSDSNYKCTLQHCKTEMWNYIVRRDVEAVVDAWDGGYGKYVHRNILGPKHFAQCLRQAGCPDEKFFLFVVNQTASDYKLSRVPVWLAWRPSEYFSKDETTGHTGAHPTTFRNLEHKSYKFLRETSSLFARKADQNTTVTTWDGEVKFEIPIDEFIRNEMLHKNYPFDSAYWERTSVRVVA